MAVAPLFQKLRLPKVGGPATEVRPDRARPEDPDLVVVVPKIPRSPRKSTLRKIWAYVQHTSCRFWKYRLWAIRWGMVAPQITHQGVNCFVRSSCHATDEARDTHSPFVINFMNTNFLPSLSLCKIHNNWAKREVCMSLSISRTFSTRNKRVRGDITTPDACLSWNSSAASKIQKKLIFDVALKKIVKNRVQIFKMR